MRAYIRLEKHSLYADDLAIWSSSSDPLKAVHIVQLALDHLKQWSLKCGFPVNLTKCECCFFSTDPTKLHINPSSLLTGTPLTFDPAPKFLDVPLIQTSRMVHMSTPFIQSSFLGSKHLLYSLCIVGSLQ